MPKPGPTSHRLAKLYGCRLGPDLSLRYLSTNANANNAQTNADNNSPLVRANPIASREASIGIAAGLNAKTLSTYLGHATITITLDRYGHLMPGSEVEARAMLDDYLDGAA